jgi:hypothetical protein
MLAIMRIVQVTPLERSCDGATPLAKRSYRVSISEVDDTVVVEARLSEGTIENLAEPEKCLEAYFSNRPVPDHGSIIDLTEEQLRSYRTKRIGF